jgi:hypothetical protein
MSKTKRALCVALLILGLLCSLTSFADVSFDGTDDLLSTAGSYNLSSFTGLTVSGWAYLTDFSGGKNVILALGSFNTAADITFMLRSNDATAIRWAISDGTTLNNLTFTTSTQSLNTWYHYLATWDGTNASVWWNGILVSTESSGIVTSLTNTAFTMYIANEGATSTTLAGSLTDVRLWPVKLSDQEIQSLALSRLANIGVRTPSSAWPLDDCGAGASGNAVGFVDRGGNSRTMTGDNGANDTGLTCQGSQILNYEWGPQ